jgi:hypothetical protein
MTGFIGRIRRLTSRGCCKLQDFQCRIVTETREADERRSPPAIRMLHHARFYAQLRPALTSQQGAASYIA